MEHPPEPGPHDAEEGAKEDLKDEQAEAESLADQLQAQTEAHHKEALRQHYEEEVEGAEGELPAAEGEDVPPKEDQKI